MTASNSKTWIKLNQIDCEGGFNLNRCRKSFVAMNFWSYYYLWHVCVIPKSRMNDHFYSYCKNTAEKDRASLYLSSNQSRIRASAAFILIFNVRSFLFLEQN